MRLCTFLNLEIIACKKCEPQNKFSKGTNCKRKEFCICFCVPAGWKWISGMCEIVHLMSVKCHLKSYQQRKNSFSGSWTYLRQSMKVKCFAKNEFFSQSKPFLSYDLFSDACVWHSSPVLDSRPRSSCRSKIALFETTIKWMFSRNN